MQANIAQCTLGPAFNEYCDAEKCTRSSRVLVITELINICEMRNKYFTMIVESVEDQWCRSGSMFSTMFILKSKWNNVRPNNRLQEWV